MNYIQTGEIVSVHGIKGEVKVYPWADYPEFLGEFEEFYIKNNKQQYQKFTAQEVRSHKNIVLIKFEGVDTVEKAREFIGKTVCVDKDKIELSEGNYFVCDLIGCKVVDCQNGNILGVIENVDNFGASDIYSIKTEKGDTVLFPAVNEFLVSTDIINKEIKVKVIEGMFSED